ncbi:MAG: peptidoglycan DD-metalloendopeptidase family protein [Candidatus Eisenbacteria bacterium]
MNRIVRFVLVVLVLGSALSEPRPSSAQTDSAETARMEAQKRRELEDIKRQAQEKRAAAGKLKGQETKVMGELRRTDRELSRTRGRLRSLQQRKNKLGVQLEVTRASLERSIQNLHSQRTKLRRRLRELYKFGPARELESLLSTRSFAELMTRWDFLTMVAQQDRVLLETVRAEKDDVEQNKSQLENHIGQVQQNEKLTTNESTKLNTLRQDRAQTVKKIQSQRATYEAAAAELERSARRIQSLLAQLERRRREDINRARAQGRDPQPYSGDFAKGLGQLDWPVRGDIVGRFGLETHPRFNTQIRNDGLDIAAAVGTSVHAVAKGRVDAADEDFEGIGGIVVLNHGDGFYTLYSHLSEVSVRSGQEVTPGQTIGRVGDEGSLKGPMLHFEVRKGTSAQNPETWLR